MTPQQFLAACLCLVAASSLPSSAQGFTAVQHANSNRTVKGSQSPTGRGQCGATGFSKKQAAKMTAQEVLDKEIATVCEETGGYMGSGCSGSQRHRRCLKVRTCITKSKPYAIKANVAKTQRNTAKDQAVKKIESYVGKGNFKRVVAQNMESMCRAFMVFLQTKKPVCGASMIFGKEITINCEKTKAGYPPKPYKAGHVLAVLDLCVSTCMEDPSKMCCRVPTAVAHRFPCCREQCCCPDNIGDTTCKPKDTLPVAFADHARRFDGRGRRRAQAAPAPHTAQVSVSVAVTVTVEETSSSLTVYDALLRCLQNPAKLDSMCLTGSSGH